MNLKTARSAKQAAESVIAQALQDFTDATGLRVDRLDVECQMPRGRESCTYTVNLEARL